MLVGVVDSKWACVYVTWKQRELAWRIAMFINASDQRYTFVVPVMNSVHWNRHMKSVRAPAQWNASSIYSGKYVQAITEQTLQQTTLKQHSYIWHREKAMYKPNDSNSYPKGKSNVRACVQFQLTDTRARTKNLYTDKVAIRHFNSILEVQRHALIYSKAYMQFAWPINIVLFLELN